MMTTDTPRPRTREVPPRPSRVLVADDEHLVAMNLTLTLGELGYTVVGPASDGDEAVELARTAAPDLALLDIRMPRLDGFDAAKALFGELGVPVVILSAYSDDADIGRAAECGVFGYLVKPAGKGQLRAAIDVAWRRFVEHAENLRDSADLRRRLDERKIIEAAKWILVSARGISEPEAMRIMQKQARDSRRKLVTIAEEIIRDNA